MVRVRVVTPVPLHSSHGCSMIERADKAIAGDYVAAFRANGRGESASADFRITVTTSTLWGIVGVGIIAVALLVLLGAVARFGRR